METKKVLAREGDEGVYRYDPQAGYDESLVMRDGLRFVVLKVDPKDDDSTYCVKFLQRTMPGPKLCRWIAGREAEFPTDVASRPELPPTPEVEPTTNFEQPTSQESTDEKAVPKPESIYSGKVGIGGVHLF